MRHEFVRGTPAAQAAAVAGGGDVEYLIFDFVSVGDGFICIFIWVEGCYKFIVVNVSVAISVKDVCHCTHLQAAGWKL